jgi:hypothetical protein
VRWAGTGPVIAATDASWKKGQGGLGYLTNTGRWGFRAVRRGRFGAAGGGTSGTPAATPAETHSAAAAPAKKKPANGVGREYRDGKFAFTVTKIKKGVRRVGDQYVGKTAQGQFVLVYVTVDNIGNEARTFDSGSQKLKDMKGREFSADGEATIAMGDESKAFLEDINPGNGVRGILVFDVPKSIKLKSLELHDSPFSGTAAPTRPARPVRPRHSPPHLVGQRRQAVPDLPCPSPPPQPARTRR